MESVNQVFLISGALAGIISRLGTHPLDSCKINLQANKGNYSLLQIISKQGGIKGLYQGVGISVLFTAPGTASYLALYEISKYQLNSSQVMTYNTTSIYFTSAIVAEVFSGIFWTPMDLIKQKLQTHQSKSTIKIIQAIYSKTGFRGFWKGYGLTLCVFIPFSGTYFVTYEQLKNSFASRTNHQVEHLPIFYVGTASAIAGILGSLVANPLDVIKTRYQLQVKPDTSVVTIIRQLYKNEGLSSFSKGALARVIWMVPQVIISMSTFEYIKQKLLNTQ